MQMPPETYATLCQQLGLDQGIPFTPNWSAGADFLQLIADHCLAAEPDIVMECSSGLTTLVLARCCEMNGGGHVYSLENGPEYGAATRKALAVYGLESRATVIDAPLEKHTVGGVDYDWYSIAELPGGPVDMLVIDGPPGFIQKHSRYPALPLLSGRLADGCAIYMDDAAREDEREIVGMWRRNLPALRHEYLETARGCSRFSLAGAG